MPDFMRKSAQGYIKKEVESLKREIHTFMLQGELEHQFFQLELFVHLN